MKALTFVLAMLCFGSMQAQKHYAGINTSQRTGILNAGLNPAELANLKEEYELNVTTLSVNFSNNKIGFHDLFGGSGDFTDMLFDGDVPANLSADLEILGPSFAFKVGKWGFAVTTHGRTRAVFKDISTELGRSIINANGIDSLAVATAVFSTHAQRAAANTWGEIGLGAAREVFKIGNHTLNAGVTARLIFPGTYARMYASTFQGTIEGYSGGIGLTDAYSDVNFAYSGSMGDDFTKASNFVNYFGGGLNGFAVDFGFNYRWDDDDNSGLYKLNAGLSVRNLGSMTFKEAGNENSSYVIDVPDGQYINLNQFSGASSITQIQQLLLESGYVTNTESSNNFVVKLPATLSLYADVKLYNGWYVTGYGQRILTSRERENQMVSQDVITIIPRYTHNRFEVYMPFSTNEVSGFATGIGARYRGFFLGSGSVITALIDDGTTTQADAYLGYRCAF